MSERRRKKSLRFLKETSDRSGIDNWHRNDEGSFTKEWQSVKQSGLTLEPEEFDMPPPSNKPLGGADISGEPRVNSDTTDVPASSVSQVQYLSDISQVALSSQSPILIAGSNKSVTIGRYTGITDSYTKLLLHFDESPFTDVTGKTVTNTDVTRSDVQSKFGGYSGLFNGTTSGLSLGYSSDFNFLDGDFTIDAWIYPTSLGVGAAHTILNWCDSTFTYFCDLRYSTVGANVLFEFELSVSPYYAAYSATIPIASITGAWTHIAVVRSGSYGCLFINGSSAYSVTGTAFGTQSFNLVDGDINIGLEGGLSYTFFEGYMDEFRISKGIARWKTSFDPYSVSYTTQINQIATASSGNFMTLLGVGSSVCIDSSNNVALRTSSYSMASGNILNLMYNSSSSTWIETSRSFLFGDLGAL